MMRRTGTRNLWYFNPVLTDWLTSRALGWNHDGFVIIAKTPAQLEARWSLPAGSAFLWQDGVTTDLGVLRGGRLSLAFDINQRGDATGYSYGANDGNEYQQGVLWTRRSGK